MSVPDGSTRVAPLYDPRSPEVIADPHATFHRLRAEDPVHRSEILGGWVLTRRDDVVAALTDPRLSADRITPFLRHLDDARRAEIGPLLESLTKWAVFNDPPEHTRIRGLLNRAFTPRAVERLRPRVEAVVDALIDRLVAAARANDGRADFVREFAYPLPATVIAELLGVPTEDLEPFKRWSDDLAAFVGGSVGDPEKYRRARRGNDELVRYFGEQIERRRREPADDLMTALVQAEDRGAMRGPDELVVTCLSLLFAGHETTTNLLGNGMLSLLRNPDQLALLEADPALIPGAVEELLRHECPVQAITRIAKQDIEWGGRRIAEGDRVFAMINAACRDPEAFPDPDRLDVRRDAKGSPAFGAGIHYCLGAPLARLEGRIAFGALLGRLTDWRLLTETPKWNDTLVLRGVKSLEVAFAERRAAPPRTDDCERSGMASASR